jgi:hypothetical protein
MDDNYLYITAGLGIIAVICICFFYFQSNKSANNSTDKKSVSFQTEESDDNLKCVGEKCPFVPKTSNCDGEKCVLN